MKIDVTLLGISGNSLRWLRRIAPWSIVPLILGALVLATVALGSVRYNGPAYQAQPALGNPIEVLEQPLTMNSKVALGKAIDVHRQPGWSRILIKGNAL